MEHRWLYGWTLASIAFGGASLIVPLYVVELGGDAFTLGVLFAASSFIGIPGALLFGRLADRTGKFRSFVLFSMAIAFAMLLVIPALESILAVIAVYAVLWLGFAAAIPVLTLLVIVDIPEAEWSANIALLNKMQGIGWTVGLLVGFALIAVLTIQLDTITAQRIFLLVCASSTAIGFLISMSTLPPNPTPSAVPSARRLRRGRLTAGAYNVRASSFPFAPTRIDIRQFHPRRFIDRFTPRLASYYLAVVLVFSGFGIFFAPLPVYLGEVGFGASEIFALYFLLNIAAVLYFERASHLVSRHDASLVQFGGLTVRAITFVAVVMIGLSLGAGLLGLGLTTLMFIMIGLTWAVIAVTAATLITQLSPPIIRGEALGTYNALIAMAGGVGGLLGGWLGAMSYPIAFTVASALVMTGGVVVLLVRRMIG